MAEIREAIMGATAVHDAGSAARLEFELQNGGIATVRASFEPPAPITEEPADQPAPVDAPPADGEETKPADKPASTDGATDGPTAPLSE